MLWTVARNVAVVLMLGGLAAIAVREGTWWIALVVLAVAIPVVLVPTLLGARRRRSEALASLDAVATVLAQQGAGMQETGHNVVGDQERAQCGVHGSTLVRCAGRRLEQ